MRYEFAGVGTGTLGGTSFQDAPFLLTLRGDTSHVIFLRDRGLYYLDGPSSFSIEGAGAGNFSAPTRAIAHPGNSAAGLSRGGPDGLDLVDLFEPDFAAYDLKTPFPLVREDEPTAVEQFANVATTAGLLTFSSIDYVTFRAVPEPSSVLTLAGLSAVVSLRRRRR
jgi:hypothetical protein